MVRFLILLVVVVGCRGGSGKGRHAGSGAPVEIVTEVQHADAGGHAAGPTADEIEPNDTDDAATPLPLGSMVRGKIDPDGDVDRYRIDVDKPGALAVMVSGIDGVDLVLEIEDPSGTVIAKSDRGGVRVKEGVPNLGVTPGRYIAVIRAAKKKSPSKSSKRNPEPEVGKPAPVYELTAQLVPPAANAEREPDEDRGTANDLIVADTGTGYLGWAGDVDTWKLSVEALSAKDAIDIEVSAVEGVALSLEVDDGLGQALLTRKAPRGAPLLVRGLVPVVPANAPPFHYLIVRGDRSNPETAYQLRVTAHVVATDAEIEPDDTPEKPFPMPADRTVVHATWTPGDVDCFAIATASAARTIAATIDAPNELDLSAELRVDGKSIATSNKGGKGVAESVSGAVPASGHAVVCVRGVDPSATAEAGYDFTVQESGATGDNAP